MTGRGNQEVKPVKLTDFVGETYLSPERGVEQEMALFAKESICTRHRTSVRAGGQEIFSAAAVWQNYVRCNCDLPNNNLSMSKKLKSRRNQRLIAKNSMAMSRMAFTGCSYIGELWRCTRRMLCVSGVCIFAPTSGPSPKERGSICASSFAN